MLYPVVALNANIMSNSSDNELYSRIYSVIAIISRIGYTVIIQSP